MLVADALSHYAPLKAPEIHLDITINHVYITPDRITEFQTLQVIYEGHMGISKCQNRV